MRRHLHTFTILSFCFAVSTLLASPPRKMYVDSPCDQLNTLNNKVRDGKITKRDAQQQLKTLLPKVKSFYYKNGGKDFPQVYKFPLAGYNSKAIGGKSGSGYIASGYNYFAGNKHGGHPAHDIFIKDKNQDDIDDNTHEKVNVLSATAGIVVATEAEWEQPSDQRGGNYIWIYDPLTNRFYYYAHNSRVLVRPGYIVKPGDVIAEVGRTGFNAIKKRSPTHLHYMVLQLDSSCSPTPVNSYTDLIKAIK